MVWTAFLACASPLWACSSSSRCCTTTRHSKSTASQGPVRDKGRGTCLVQLRLKLTALLCLLFQLQLQLIPRSLGRRKKRDTLMRSRKHEQWKPASPPTFFSNICSVLCVHGCCVRPQEGGRIFREWQRRSTLFSRACSSLHCSPRSLFWCCADLASACKPPTCTAHEEDNDGNRTKQPVSLFCLCLCL